MRRPILVLWVLLLGTLLLRVATGISAIHLLSAFLGCIILATIILAKNRLRQNILQNET